MERTDVLELMSTLKLVETEEFTVENGLAGGARGTRTVGPPSAGSLKEAHLSSSSGGVGPRSVTLPEFVA